MAGDTPLTARYGKDKAGVIVFHDDGTVGGPTDLTEFATLNLGVLAILEDIDYETALGITADANSTLLFPGFECLVRPLPVSFSPIFTNWQDGNQP